MMQVEVRPPCFATFRYAKLATTPVATPTDFVIIQGAANIALHVKRIALSGVATAAGNMPAQLIRRSTANTTNGVLTAITPGRHDMNDPPPRGVVSTVGTANFGSLGTSQGVLGAGRVQMPASGSGVAAFPLVWDFATRLDKAVILRGALDFLCINLNGAAVPSGGVLDVEIETEEFAA